MDTQFSNEALYGLRTRDSDAYFLRTRPLRRTADLKQLREFPLAPSQLLMKLMLLACLHALFHLLAGEIKVAILLALIWSFTRLPLG